MYQRPGGTTLPHPQPVLETTKIPCLPLPSSILFVSTNTFPFFSLKGFPVLASQAGEIHSHPVWLVVRPSYILKGRTRKAKYQRESTIINDMKRWTKSIDLLASTQI